MFPQDKKSEESSKKWGGQLQGGDLCCFDAVEGFIVEECSNAHDDSHENLVGIRDGQLGSNCQIEQESEERWRNYRDCQIS